MLSVHDIAPSTVPDQFQSACRGVLVPKAFTWSLSKRKLFIVRILTKGLIILGEKKKLPVGCQLPPAFFFFNLKKKQKEILRQL